MGEILSLLVSLAFLGCIYGPFCRWVDDLSDNFLFFVFHAFIRLHWGDYLGGGAFGFWWEIFFDILSYYLTITSFILLQDNMACENHLIIRKGLFSVSYAHFETPRILMYPFIPEFVSFSLLCLQIRLSDLELLGLSNEIWSRSKCPIANPRSTTLSTQIISNFEMPLASENSSINFIQDRNIIDQLEF